MAVGIETEEEDRERATVALPLLEEPKVRFAC